jgi:hypothetical protein
VVRGKQGEGLRVPSMHLRWLTVRSQLTARLRSKPESEGNVALPCVTGALFCSFFAERLKAPGRVRTGRQPSVGRTSYVTQAGVSLLAAILSRQSGRLMSVGNRWKGGCMRWNRTGKANLGHKTAPASLL